MPSSTRIVVDRDILGVSEGLSEAADRIHNVVDVVIHPLFVVLVSGQIQVVSGHGVLAVERAQGAVTGKVALVLSITAGIVPSSLGQTHAAPQW